TIAVVILALVLVEPRLRCLQGPMRLSVSGVSKKGLTVVDIRVDELDQMVGEEIGSVASWHSGLTRTEVRAVLGDRRRVRRFVGEVIAETAAKHREAAFETPLIRGFARARRAANDT